MCVCVCVCVCVFIQSSNWPPALPALLTLPCYTSLALPSSFFTAHLTNPSLLIIASACSTLLYVILPTSLTLPCPTLLHFPPSYPPSSPLPSLPLPTSPYPSSPYRTHSIGWASSGGHRQPEMQANDSANDLHIPQARTRTDTQTCVCKHLFVCVCAN